MQQSNIKPSGHIFVATLKACSSILSVYQGKLIHLHIIETDCESDAYIGSALIDMYSKCGSLHNARGVFNRLPKRDLAVWSAMIAGYALHGYGQKALQLFSQMQKNGMDPDNMMLVSILKACSSIGALDQGKVIHGHIVENCAELDVYIGSTLIDMYSECGSLQDADSVFRRLPKRDVVLWSAMIAAYGLHKPGQEALHLFDQMQQDGIEPNNVTFVSIVKACCNICGLEQGGLIHSYLIKNCFVLEIHVETILIDMYAKCGSLEDAQRTFDMLVKRNVVTWNAIIAGYVHHGDYTSVLQLFEKMQQEGLKPNNVTFVCLLSAGSHLGLLYEGCHNFEMMTKEYGCAPILDHYNCMVDLFGRSGHLNEAEDLLNAIPFGFNFVGWSSLLSHCKVHGNVNLGRRCFNQIVTMNDQYSSGYVTMRNIYADARMWEDAGRVQELRECAYAWKKPGNACLEVESRLHEFVVGDKSHLQSSDLYAKLKRVDVQVKEDGHCSIQFCCHC